MMKWMILTGMIVIISGCCCSNATTEVYTYRQVVTPITYRQVAVRPIISPVVYETIEPLNVTTTTVDFY
jgi:hypothetical protein